MKSNVVLTHVEKDDYSNSTVVVIHQTCGACTGLLSELITTGQKNKSRKMVLIDVGKNIDFRSMFGIEVVPTILVFNINGEIMGRSDKNPWNKKADCMTRLLLLKVDDTPSRMSNVANNNMTIEQSDGELSDTEDQ